MAKKKIQNVVIKDEELTPTTLGVYSNKTKNPIPLLILIAVFIAIVIYLPTIQSYVNKKLGKTDDNPTYNNNGNNNNNNDDDNDDDNQDNKKYELSSTTKVDAKNYTLNNIALTGTTLSLTFQNKTNSSFDLSNYYIELYSSEGTFIRRVKVSSDTIEANGTKNYSYTVPTNISEFAFVSKTENDYPEVTLMYNELQEANLVCRNGKMTYTYSFVDDNLVKISNVYAASVNDNADYANLYQQYFAKSNAYNLVDGVTSTCTNDAINSFYFTANIDLSKADISKIDDENVLAHKTSPKVVKFQEEARGFTCNQE